MGKPLLNFATDYMCGALPEVLNALVKTNLEATPGYGEDCYCKAAKEFIRSLCNCPDAEVWFTSGGTQTNATVIDSVVRPGQGVIAATSSHINVHESGAVEAYGHKVLTLPETEGKISAADLELWLTDFYADETWQHMVEPGLVYITFPTEYGTTYSRHEVEAIHDVCQRFNKPLYIDGARLGYGLAASDDIQLSDLLNLCEVFYIGGTKQGTLFGEAVVARPDILHNFFTQTKRHGGLMAKGRLLGVQFLTLFENDLYLSASAKAVALAASLRANFIAAGYEPVGNSPTNQQFFRLPNALIDHLADIATFELWGARGSEYSVVRFVTSWATTADEVAQLSAAVADFAANAQTMK